MTLLEEWMPSEISLLSSLPENITSVPFNGTAGAVRAKRRGVRQRCSSVSTSGFQACPMILTTYSTVVKSAIMPLPAAFSRWLAVMKGWPTLRSIAQIQCSKALRASKQRFLLRASLSLKLDQAGESKPEEYP